MTILRPCDIGTVLDEITVQSGILREGKAGPAIITKTRKEAAAGAGVADHATTFRHRLAGCIFSEEREIQECFRFTDNLLPAHVSYFGMSDPQARQAIETIAQEETITPGVITAEMLQYVPVIRKWVATVSGKVQELLRDTKDWKVGNAEDLSSRLMEAQFIVQRMLMYSMNPENIPRANVESTSITAQLIMWMSASVSARCMQLIHKEVHQFPQAVQALMTKKVRQTYTLGPIEQSFLHNVRQQQENFQKANGYALLVQRMAQAVPALKDMEWPEHVLKDFPHEGVGSWHGNRNTKGAYATYQWAKRPTILGEAYKFGPDTEGASKDPLFHYVTGEFNVCPALAPYAGIEWEALPGGSRELLISMIASGRSRVKNFLSHHPVLASRLPYVGHIQMSMQKNEATIAVVYEEGMRKPIEEALSPKLPHVHGSDEKGDFFYVGMHRNVDFNDLNPVVDDCSISKLLHEKFGHCLQYSELEDLLLHIGIEFDTFGGKGSHSRITNPANGATSTLQHKHTGGRTADVPVHIALNILKQLKLTKEQEYFLEDFCLPKNNGRRTPEKTPQTAA